MPQNQQKRSEVWWRGHNDALAGDPPNESFYHYYYDYKLAYDQVRRDQRRLQRKRIITVWRRRLLIAVPLMVIVGGVGYGAWNMLRPDQTLVQQVEQPTSTPRPTPRPTLPPPTPTPEPALRPDGFAQIQGTDGAPLNARSKPGLKEARVTRFREGQIVHLLEGPQTADDLEWWRVEAEGQTGWTAAKFLEPVEQTATP